MPKNQFYALLVAMIAFATEGLTQATISGTVADDSGELVIGAYVSLAVSYTHLTLPTKRIV